MTEPIQAVEVPPPEEMRKVFNRARAERGAFQDGIEAIHALVAARVAEHRPRVLPVVQEQPPKIDPGEPVLDPIKAIVELADILSTYISGATSGSALEKLVALKRSLEPGAGDE
jgi:hypothetical protein